MSTSNTYSYDITAGGLITDALRIISVLEEGVTASTTQLNDALPTLEMYLKSMSKYGLNLWTINNEGEVISLVSGTAAYSVPANGNRSLKILEALYRDSSDSDTILTRLSREEYYNLGDKTTSGEPTQFFYDPNSQPTSKVYLWPVPDSTAATGDLVVVYQSYIQDVSDTTYTLDVPREWLETIKYGLAVRLAPMFGYPVQERGFLRKEYKEMLDENLNWDTEQESIYLQPTPDRSR